MPLDLAALRKAAKRLNTAHAERPDARRTTGASALIRAALPEIRRLRDEEGMPWAVIAEALGEQGVRQGREGKPITADRLIALVRQIEAQLARAEASLVARAERVDLSGPPSVPTPEPMVASSSAPPPSSKAGRPRLSPELQARPMPISNDRPMTEAEIRQHQVDKHSHLFKKD